MPKGVGLAGALSVENGVALAAPSFGPAVVSLFGVNVPILAMCLSVLGLVLARMIAPPPTRKLSRGQDYALTILLVCILFMVVTGQLYGGEPMGVGMAFVWAIGLGFSGLLVIEFFGNRVMETLRLWTGQKGQEGQGPPELPAPPIAPYDPSSEIDGTGGPYDPSKS